MLKTDIKNISLSGNETETGLLRDIDFQLEDNKIYVILGKNGSGKSTLIRALTGLLDNRFYKITGRVLLDNISLLSLSADELLKIRKTKIRYVFQDAINSFDPLKKIGYYFRSFENFERLDSLLNGFLLPGRNELFNLFPYEVSGGMAQRLLLVLTIMAEPQILILDEPTSGIDTPISNLILLKLKDYVKENNHSVLMVTQDVEFAKSAGDTIAFLSDSKLSPFYPVEKFFETIPAPGMVNFISAYKQLI
jgi:ABC-type glutathione transport system ATPase component